MLKNKKWIRTSFISLLALIILVFSIIWFTPKLKLQAFKWVFESGERTTLNQLEKGEIDFSEVNIESNIAYRDTGNQGHLLDIYRPKVEDSSKPLIINVHGGGLFASYKETNLRFNLEFVERGHTVVNISYRLIPETSFWNQIDDVMTAYRYLNDNKERLNLNLDNVYVVGDSAGALLTLMSTSVNNSPELQEKFGIKSSGLSIKGLGLISIMLDNQRDDLMKVINDFIVAEEEENHPAINYLLNPASVISKTQLPPVYLITSKEDLIESDTLKLERILSDNKVEYQIKDYDKGTDKELVHVFSTIHPEWEESQDVIDRLSTFFVERSK